ncbi:MAG: hypothetical protein CVU52_05625 [Deltaproteobacteria bacterium HGW-Deltaproteobacteria-10]|nr:MAG: hypothetical protein CVU52_05625 [Deltaproteobacteria bacterium HGW-Deltaproteobacteria-10]
MLFIFVLGEKLTILLIIIVLFIGLLLFKGTGTLHERLFPGLYNSVEFPEDRFPAQNQAAFQKNVAAGYEYMRGVKVVICGLTRDDAPILPLTIARVEKTGGFFRDYRVIVYENDSQDGTLDILKRWEAANPRVKILTESIWGTELMQLGRTAKLAYFRNRYLQLVKESDKYADCDFVIVADMDLKGGWSNDGIATSFFRSDWDMVAANSIGYHNLRRTYYDMFALLPKTIFKTGLVYKIFGEGWQLHRGDPFIAIQSGFGGLALYRREAIVARQYSGVVNGARVCEHVSLNADNSLRCFLNPSQITVIGTQEKKKYKTGFALTSTLRKFFLNW